ncbi:DUF3800 domain-containing protein [Specibacter cremeus]|uniref:DUF3800 domain-containing protein n=1 Tax=Specibacter cremeus TaxID=1629051 RepID=UPI000F7A7B89|nr:DUF3800 domain-containing protein [Specibacter cremeus]
MHIAYVDDTKQKGLRVGMGELVALAAVIFPEDQVKPFADAFYACYDEFEVPHDVELKWSYAQNKNWFRETNSTDKQTPLREAVLQAACEHDAQAIVVAWDLAGGVATAGRERPEDAVITFMFERISMQLENGGHRGLIVFDKPGGDHKTEADWLTGRRDMVTLGTKYVKPNAVVTQVLTAPSHLHPHLQLADLVAGSFTGAIAGNKYGMELVPLVRPMLCANSWGIVPQTGVKLYPDDMNNLHYWVYGADTIKRGSSRVGLPKTGWRYYEDAGMPV